MARSRYIKTKSDYTLRKKHKAIDGGTIYEHDYMTISPSMESLFAKDEYVLQDSNFKFSTRTGINLQKKHKRGSWIPNGVCEGDQEFIWTTECIGSGITSDEGRIVLKPDYNSIKQFAYYGGATNLVKASVNDIILHFPGELYFLETPLYLTRRTEATIDTNYLDYVIPDSSLREVKNDYSINIDYTFIEPDMVYEPFRFFCLHWEDYVIEKSNGTITPVTGWSVSAYTENECSGSTRNDYAKIADVKINNINLCVYKDYNTGKKCIGYKGTANKNISIHPKESVIEEYFQKLDDFEKVLLSRDSNPIYTAKFITPKMTDTGFTYTLQNYTWPVIKGYSPELSSNAFDIYFSSLLSTAEYHDEWDSDNIWRSMTHEAIKNLDWTFIRNNGETLEDLSHIDNSKVVPILKIWGRNLDDLKRFIDNIKACNTITYNSKNNIPDYFLSDVLEINGWETKVLHLHTEQTYRTDILYSGMTRGYNSPETDVEFFKRLNLNSHYILRTKGTRNSIGTMLSLFGIRNDEYSITEHIAVAKPKDGGYATGFAIPDESYAYSGKTTYPLANEVAAINQSRSGYFYKHGNDPYGGIPVNVVSIGVADNVSLSYVIPWYRNGYEYDGGMYFQMSGGWSKRRDKRIYLPDLAPNVKVLKTSEGGLQIYDETQTYLHFVENIDGLKEMATEDMRKNAVCYVTDITDVSTEYSFKNDSEKNNFKNNNFSHYFILKNEELSFKIGYSEDNSDYGWKNVLNSEIYSANTFNGKLVLYLESIANETEGNNPHVGNGQYDDGNEYLNRLGTIFHYGLSNGEFGAYDDANCVLIKNYGFRFEEEDDNQKCWYFADTSNPHNSIYVSGSTESFGVVDITTSSAGTNIEWSAMEKPEEPTYNPFNPEKDNSGKTDDEAAANSIVNLKNMQLTIYYPYCMHSNLKPLYKEFIEDVVMFYVKQVIPSTTIFGFSIEEKQWTEEEAAKYSCEYHSDDTPEPEPEPEPEPDDPDETYIYGLRVETISSTSLNNGTPCEVKAFWTKYKGKRKTENNIVSKEDVTSLCTFFWTRDSSSPACRNLDARTEGTFVNTSNGIVYRITTKEDADTSKKLGCPLDKWRVSYTNGSDHDDTWFPVSPFPN